MEIRAIVVKHSTLLTDKMREAIEKEITDKVTASAVEVDKPFVLCVPADMILKIVTDDGVVEV
jgi:hypothetical protein